MWTGYGESMPRNSTIRRSIVVLLSSAFVSTCGETPFAPIDVSREWIERAPDDLGMDAALLERADLHARSVPRFRSLLVARRGALVMERYYGGAGRETLHDVRSVTKSVVSTLAGIARAKGLLPNLDTTMAAYLAGYALDTDDSSVTVRHLLTMTSGYAWDENTTNSYNTWILSGDDHVQYVLDLPHATASGAEFTYNSGAVHVLGVLITRATGMSLPEFADQTLFGPMGAGPVAWEPMDPGTVNGGAGLDLRGRDLLRFGQLFLQRGRSGDEQLIPEAWVSAATASRFSWRTTFGPQESISYGYLWWVADPPGAEAYFAWGYGGQFVYVVPSLELVVVTTTEWRGVSADVGADALAAAALDIIVNDVVPAAR